MDPNAAYTTQRQRNSTDDCELETRDRPATAPHTSSSRARVQVHRPDRGGTAETAPAERKDPYHRIRDTLRIR